MKKMDMTYCMTLQSTPVVMMTLMFCMVSAQISRTGVPEFTLPEELEHLNITTPFPIFIGTYDKDKGRYMILDRVRFTYPSVRRDTYMSNTNPQIWT